MSWFRREKTPRASVQDRTRQMPEGIWRKCDACKEVLYAKAIQQNGQACPRCDFHFPISVEERLDLMMDPGYEEIARGLTSLDPLEFKDQTPYRDRLAKHRERTGREDAVVIVRGTIAGHDVTVCVMDFDFMGGSLGSVVGEKITRGVERSLEERIPLIIVCASGGARMQEGAISLMQMAKVNAALARLDGAGLPFISVLTNPTTGGVTASYAMVGDIIMAEPGALIGFAGPRVIEQTIKQVLPEGFQRSEFLLAHGMIDMVVPRRQMRETIARCLAFFCGAPQEGAGESTSSERAGTGAALPRGSASTSDRALSVPDARTLPARPEGPLAH